MKLFRCNKCGKVIDIIDEKDTKTICCDEEMKELIANTTEGAREKHIPYINVDGAKVNVKIGKIEHPMIDNHYIEWIACCYNDYIVRKYLKPGDKPEAVFDYKNNMKIYAYCNLHGLWLLDKIEDNN